MRHLRIPIMMNMKKTNRGGIITALTVGLGLMVLTTLEPSTGVLATVAVAAWAALWATLRHHDTPQYRRKNN